VPVDILEVSIYEDADHRRFLHVESEHEPVLASKPETAVQSDPATKVDGRRITVADLIEADPLKPGEHLVWDRPRLGVSYGATVTSNAVIELDDGGTFATPSRAAKHAANIPAYDGWYAWKVERPGGMVLLYDLTQASSHQASAACLVAAPDDSRGSGSTGAARGAPANGRLETGGGGSAWSCAVSPSTATPCRRTSFRARVTSGRRLA
jgi:hypothetical protein